MLTDKYQRKLDYLRVSITDKCNLRCFYCMPKGFREFEQPDNWLTFDEIERVARVFSELGIARLRLTGGEPLLRKNLTQLAHRLTALPGLDDLSLSTNAVLLAKHAGDLHEAGICRINVSLDTLQKERFTELTRRGGLEQVFKGLEAAQKVGLTPIKVNMIPIKGVNDDEIADFARLSIERKCDIRFIED